MCSGRPAYNTNPGRRVPRPVRVPLKSCVREVVPLSDNLKTTNAMVALEPDEPPNTRLVVGRYQLPDPVIVKPPDTVFCVALV